MKALVDTTDKVKYYTPDTPITDDEGNVIETPHTEHIIETGRKITQVAEDNAVFEVHSSLIWVDCDNSLNAFNLQKYYYDTTDSTIKLIPTS